MTTPMAVICRAKGHEPQDIDPTGGDPYIGGPVAITVCRWCGEQLEASETAQAFNVEVRRRRARIEEDERGRHVRLRRRWWHRVARCSCGWRERKWLDHNGWPGHVESKAGQAAWSR